LLVIIRSVQHPEPDDRPAPWIVLSIVTAVGIFLVHNLIDVALFEPGPMGVFAILLGAALGARRQDGNGGQSNRQHHAALAALVLFATLLIWLAAAFGVVAPVAIAESMAQKADREVRAGHPDEAARTLRDAFEKLWITNSDYAFRAAIAMMQANVPADQIRQIVDAAIAADPTQVRTHRLAIDLELRQPVPDTRRIIQNYQQIIALDPMLIQARVEFADVLAKTGQTQAAIEQYRQAILLDNQLDAAEPKRMTRQQIDQIEQKIRSLSSG
jgi:tetratricopeptide (TPR) repeat protein